MAGREFTLLDIYIGTWMAEYVLENDVSAAVYEYWKRISSRTAFRIAANVY
jgi:glutathione S-transferase